MMRLIGLFAGECALFAATTTACVTVGHGQSLWDIWICLGGIFGMFLWGFFMVRDWES